MSERFTEIVSIGTVIDNVTCKEYNCEMRIDDKLLDLMNSLDIENRQLSFENEELEEEVYELSEDRQALINFIRENFPEDYKTILKEILYD